jgi:hypothetical protein
MLLRNSTESINVRRFPLLKLLKLGLSETFDLLTSHCLVYHNAFQSQGPPISRGNSPSFCRKERTIIKQSLNRSFPRTFKVIYRWKELLTSAASSEFPSCCRRKERLPSNNSVAPFSWKVVGSCSWTIHLSIFRVYNFSLTANSSRRWMHL